jgi:CDGSH-type Zn-finger protein
LRIDTGEDLVAETRAALCRCGATTNAPFCDGAGDCHGWHERAAELDAAQSGATGK